MKRKIIAVLAFALILTSCGNADNDQSTVEKSSTVSSEVSIVTDDPVDSADSSSGNDLSEESSQTDESSSEASDPENATQTVGTKTISSTVSDTTTAESAEYLPEPAETTTTTAPATTTTTTTAPKPATTTTPKPTTTTTTTTQPQPIPEVNAMKIKINGTEYTAHFSDTAAAEEFKTMLPLTLEMSELNGNEKYIYLDTGFTTSSEKVGYINKGDILLYGSSCVVLFYDSFSTPYSYTRLGYIDDPSGLENAVGSGSVTVTFEGE